MVTVKQTLASIVALRREGLINEEEERRLVRYALQDLPAPSGLVQNQVNSTQSDPTATVQQSVSTVSRVKGRQRRYAGRGRYGWVNLERAEDVNLVTLLELGGNVSRP